MAKVIEDIVKGILGYLKERFKKDVADYIYDSVIQLVYWIKEKATDYIQPKKTAGTDKSGLKASCDKFKADIEETVRGKIDQSLKSELLQKIGSFADELMAAAA